jgi:hypothetical protein
VTTTLSRIDVPDIERQDRREGTNWDFLAVIVVCLVFWLVTIVLVGRAV